MKTMTPEDKQTIKVLVRVGFKKLEEGQMYLERASKIAERYGLRLGDLEVTNGR